MPRFEDAVLLEFGRGFRYTRPLRVNLMDLDYELLEELVRTVLTAQSNKLTNGWPTTMTKTAEYVCIILFWLSLFKDNIAERECCSVPCKCNGQRGDRGAVGVPGPKVKFILRETTYFTLQHRLKKKKMISVCSCQSLYCL